MSLLRSEDADPGIYLVKLRSGQPADVLPEVDSDRAFDAVVALVREVVPTLRARLPGLVGNVDPLGDLALRVDARGEDRVNLRSGDLCKLAGSRRGASATVVTNET